MIFSPELIRAIRKGHKTQTRRLIQLRGGVRLPNRYKQGRDYAIQRELGAPAEPEKIHITGVHTAQLGTIDYNAARREGFRTSDDFKLHWVELHDKSWFVILQSAFNEGALMDTEVVAQQLERFEAKWARKSVYVISFRLAEEHRLLTPAGRPAGSELGYTGMPHQAMPDEPEAITGEALERQVAAAHSTAAQRRDKETRATRQQLRDSIDELAARHDIGEEAMRRLERMRRELRKLEQGLAT